MRSPWVSVNRWRLVAQWPPDHRHSGMGTAPGTVRSNTICNQLNGIGRRLCPYNAVNLTGTAGPWQTKRIPAENSWCRSFKKLAGTKSPIQLPSMGLSGLRRRVQTANQRQGF